MRLLHLTCDLSDVEPVTDPHTVLCTGPLIQYYAFHYCTGDYNDDRARTRSNTMRIAIRALVVWVFDEEYQLARSDRNVPFLASLKAYTPIRTLVIFRTAV